MLKAAPLLILLSLSGLLATSGCGNAPMDHHTTWCILLDMSGVRENPDTRTQYKANFSRIVDQINPGDAFIVAMITESSINEPDFVLQHVFRQFKATSDNELIRKSEEKNFDSLFLAEKQQVMEQGADFILTSPRVTGSTDILSALHVAENIFKKYPFPEKNLIILSDMEQYSSDYKFPSENLSQERINQILDIERGKARGVPDLSGVKVYVAGARSKDSDRFFRIKNFWLAYFDACHATLMKEDYGATLIDL